MSEDLISSLYPPPPLFYKYFTAENKSKYEALQNQRETTEDSEEITGELKFFKPPTPPDGLYYRGYGNIWSFEDRLPNLEDMGLTQLFPSEVLNDSQSKIQELHKLIKSLLSNFIELLGIMSINPKEFTSKIEDLKTIVININHILNSYRPHQSRESLITLIKNQINHKNNEILTIENKINEIRTNIKNLIDYNLTASSIESGEEINGNNDLVNKILSELK